MNLVLNIFDLLFHFIINIGPIYSYILLFKFRHIVICFLHCCFRLDKTRCTFIDPQQGNLDLAMSLCASAVGTSSFRGESKKFLPGYATGITVNYYSVVSSTCSIAGVL